MPPPVPAFFSHFAAVRWLGPLVAVAAALPGADATPAADAASGVGDICVLAAASTTESLQALAKQWQDAHHQTVVCSFGSSTTLAHQIESGAPADVFLSADEASMDDLAQHQAIAADSRVDLLGNTLVVVAPVGAPFSLTLAPGTDFPGTFAGRLAIGDPAHVPAGAYAREALTSLGWWAPLQDRLAPADNVRAALRLVETGVCAAGVVYATDAAASAKVVTVGTFPESSHKPIRYPVALTAHARPAAAAFCAWLAGPQAAAVFTAHHFLAVNATMSTATAAAPAGGR
jgi:molybdate transport system substrate-binding protein